VSARAAAMLKTEARPPLRMARSLKLSRDLREVPVELYRLPTDGRKWKAVARERMALAEWLSTYGDADGTRIWPSVGSMVLHFGWSRGKVFYLLADLKKLKLLDGEPAGRRGGARTAKDPRGALTGEHGTRKRRMNLAAFLGAEVQDSEAGVQDSAGAEVQHSRAEVQSNVGHNRHLTDTKTPLPPAAAGGNGNGRRPSAPISVPNRFIFDCRGGWVVEVLVPIGRKLWRNEKEGQSFRSRSGADDIRGPYAEAVMEFFKLKGYQARIAEAPQAHSAEATAAGSRP
jgi:hypothetical protein